MTFFSKRASDLPCSYTWCHATGLSERKDPKRTILPIQHSWVANAASVDSLNGTTVDVKLYVRGGTWVEQFASKLVGEVKGNHHLSSIYVSGDLREKGESEYRKKLETRGIAFPSGFHCDEWVLHERQGNVIVIKLEYAKPLILEGINVFLETSLTDPNVFWSLPVLVSTGNEPVFGREVKSGIYSPAIAGQEIVVGISNRGSDNVAVMPYFDGQPLLQSPYFLWSVETTKKDPERHGSTFVTILGLQKSMLMKRKEKVEVTYQKLKYGTTRIVPEASAVSLHAEQGCLKVLVYKPKKIVFRTDPSRAMEQLEGIRNSIFGNSAAKSIGPLTVSSGNTNLLSTYNLHVAPSDEDKPVKHVLSSVEMSHEAQVKIGEVKIHYRALSWFKEAASVKHRKDPSPLPAPAGDSPRPLMARIERIGKYTLPHGTPDSISPLENGPLKVLPSRDHQESPKPSPELSPALSPEQPTPTPPPVPGPEATLNQEISSGLNSSPPSGTGVDHMRKSLEEIQRSLETKLAFSRDPVPAAEGEGTDDEVPGTRASFSGPVGRQAESPAAEERQLGGVLLRRSTGTTHSGPVMSPRMERLSQPKVREDRTGREDFASSLRGSYEARPGRSGDRSSRDSSPAPSRLRDSSPSPAGGASSRISRSRDPSPSPAGSHTGRLREKSPSPAGMGSSIWDKSSSPAGIGSRVRDKSPSPAGVGSRVRDKSPSPAGVGSRVRDKSPSPAGSATSASTWSIRDKSPSPSSTSARSSPAAPADRHVSSKAAPSRVRDHSPAASHRATAGADSSPSSGSATSAPPSSSSPHVPSRRFRDASLPPTTARKLSFEKPPPEDIPAVAAVVWVVPRLVGNPRTFQKDEIELRSAVRNVAHLRRQVKQDLSPLFDSWSTAELTVYCDGDPLGPEVSLSSLGEEAGSAARPFVVEAPEKSQA